MAEVMPEPVREHLDPALAPAAGDDLVDAAGGHRAAVVDAEPQLRPVLLGVPGSDPDVSPRPWTPGCGPAGPASRRPGKRSSTTDGRHRPRSCLNSPSTPTTDQSP